MPKVVLKTFARLLLIALVTVGPTSGVQADGLRYRLEISGMVCRICSYAVEKRLKDLDGVELVEIDLDQGVAVVTLKEGGRLDQSTAEHVIKGAGFELKGFGPLPGVASN